MSNMTQALFALVAPANPLVNVMSNATTGTVAVTSEGLMQDYRAGAMIGSTPRSMTNRPADRRPDRRGALGDRLSQAGRHLRLDRRQGPTVGPGRPAHRRLHSNCSPAARARSPTRRLWAAGVAAVLGIIFAILEDRKKIAKYVPSPTGLGLGMLLPFAAISTIFTGSVGGQIWKRVSPGTAAAFLVPLASGLIAGEAADGGAGPGDPADPRRPGHPPPLRGQAAQRLRLTRQSAAL
jgi:hypothetical protein